MDVDRPYGRQTLFRQTLSRISSDCYFPKIRTLGFLDDLGIILEKLNQINARSYIFFRKCSLPSPEIIKLIDDGGHIIGLHLENSRTYETFTNELKNLQIFLGRKVNTFSKHGSGKFKYGLHHYPSYEPEKYVEWGKKANMHIFFGNDQNPTKTEYMDNGLHIFPSAFWLEPFWRNTAKFDRAWLEKEAHQKNIVILFHPDNATADSNIFNELSMILEKIPTTIV